MSMSLPCPHEYSKLLLELSRFSTNYFQNARAGTYVPIIRTKRQRQDVPTSSSHNNSGSKVTPSSKTVTGQSIRDKQSPLDETNSCIGQLI